MEKTITSFAQLSGLSEKELEEAYLSAEVFREFEKGLITEADFRQTLRDQLSLQASDAEFDEAWNAMLGEIPKDRIDSVLDLMKNYKCIVLSNTNSIHERSFHNILSQNYSYKHLKDVFHEVYFSHDLKQRKPDQEIYQNVLSLAQTQANEALFIDDSQSNLDSAAQLGISTLHIPRNSGFTNLVKNKLSEI